MQVCHGKSVFGGIAIGKLWVFAKKEHQIEELKCRIPKRNLHVLRRQKKKQ